MDDIVTKIHLLLKAEMLLFRLQLRRTVRQAAFYVAAALLAVLAVGMLNIALYLYLAPRLDNSSAALAVAIIDIVLAVAAAIAAGHLNLGPEADAARAVREDAMAKIATDAERVKTQITDLHDDIKRIRTAVTDALSFSGANLAWLLQWIPVLLRLLLRRKDRPAD